MKNTSINVGSLTAEVSVYLLGTSIKYYETTSLTKNEEENYYVYF